MALGLKLNEAVKITLGENRKQLIEKLEKEEIRHKVMYDKENDQNELETIINISEFDIEVQLYDNIIYAVRTYNNPHTNLYKHGERYGTPLKFLARVKDKLRVMCDNEDINVEIEKIDLGTMQCRFTVRDGRMSYKVSSTRDAHGNIYIGNIRLYLI